jgi:Leucine-rich repeat (LRR) protein
MLLPPSIGKLQNLKYLDLSWTNDLLRLPEEIGNLANLNKLCLSIARITMLPPSIGQLQNLKILDLSFTFHLLTLPEEIGNLTNLNTFSLSKSGVTMLPPSIGQLQNLKFLDLGDTEDLLTLPEEMGNLASLNRLNLIGSGVTMLSPSIRKKLGYSLACDRARSRIEPIQTTPKLWPLVLNNATRAFMFRREPSLFDLLRYCKDYRVQKPDAIYQLLVNTREQFIRILVNRDNTSEELRGKQFR